MKSFAIPIFVALLAAIPMAATLSAQQSGYQQTNLVANLPNVTTHTDSQLTNSWGIAILPGNPFWIANNNGGTSTVYDAQGNKQTTVVTIPGAANNPCSPGCPTGIVANATTDFSAAAFIFDTEDGIIANWTGASSALNVLDNSAAGAVYKGLALVNNGSGDFLLAANFNSGKIDVIDRNFTMTSLAGSFTDPNLPAGFSPHGIHVVGNQVYVAYAMQDGAKHDPVTGAGSGVVDIFDVNGNFVKTLATGGTLNAPWGVVQTPANFGQFSNAILVGNFGDGTISAFDMTGKPLGQVSDSANKVIVNPGLWDMIFGQSGTGDPNTLYFTAGGSDETQGLFATLVPAAAANADFSLSLSTTSATVTAGQSASITVDSAAVGGFNSPIALSCSGLPPGLACTFSPSSITPGSSTADSTMKVAVPTGYMVPSGYSSSGLMGWLSLSGVGVFGMVFANRKHLTGTTARTVSRVLGTLALGLLLAGVFTFVGCGGGSSSRSNNTGPITMMVTGTSGAISHSTPLTLTIQ